MIWASRKGVQLMWSPFVGIDDVDISSNKWFRSARRCISRYWDGILTR